MDDKAAVAAAAAEALAALPAAVGCVREGEAVEEVDAAATAEAEATGRLIELDADEAAAGATFALPVASLFVVDTFSSSSLLLSSMITSSRLCLDVAAAED